MANDWYAVIYNPVAGNSSYKVIEGESQAEAAQNLAVNGQLLGPYGSQSAAASAAESKVTSENASKPKAVNIPGITPAVNAASNAYAEIGSISAFIEKLGERQTWIRIGEFAAGAILIAICMKTLAEETSVGKAVQATAASAAKTGRKVADVATIAAA
jgi:hypothetical protein